MAPHSRSAPTRTGRRHRSPRPLLLLVGLLATGGGYAALHRSATARDRPHGVERSSKRARSSSRPTARPATGSSAAGHRRRAEPHRRRRRIRRLPGRHRTHADGRLRSAGPAEARRSSPRSRSPRSPPTCHRSAPAPPSPPRSTSTARAMSRTAPSCSASTARCATTSPAPAAPSPRASTPRR